MAPNPYKLANPNPVTDYNLYRDNQVLTAQQLNKNVKYFDRQLRLSRVCLQGCGIVCGMEVSYNSGQKKITVTKGNGITTDGDLLFLDKKTTYTKFKLFDDQKAKYPPLWNGETQINAWQLFPGNSTVSDIEPLTAFNTSERNLSNMVVVLYLSSYEEPPKDCNTTDCDNLGLKQINNLVVLLVSKDDIDNIIDGTDVLFDKNEEIEALTSSYNELNVPRVVLSELPASDYLKLHDVYHKVITETGPTLRNALIDTLNDKSLDFITGKLYDVTTISIWKSVLNQAFSAVKSYSALNIQYRYDFLKDLTEAYNEFVYELNELMVECCPSVNSFPKHLMLRELVLSDADQDADYRHSFYPSPIITNADERIKRIQALHLRINDMIRTFRVEIANVNELEDNVPVRITPSQTPINPLGLRAIPYYYSKQKANKYWNYDKTLRRKENTVLSYHAEKYAASTAIANPLDYSIDKNDFFRIEGHIGRTYQNVLIELIGKKTAEGLPFDIIALKLGNDTSKMILENDHCELREIESEYNLWLNDMDSLYTMVSGYFSTLKPQEITSEYVTGSSTASTSSGDSSGSSTGTGSETGSGSGNVLTDAKDDKIASTKTNIFSGKTSGKTAYGTKGANTIGGGGLIDIYNATGSTKETVAPQYATLQYATMPKAAKLYDEGTIAQNIKDNMSTEEGSLGSVITELPDFDGGSFEYYAYQLDQHFGKLDFYDKIPPYIRSIALSYPSQVISKLLEITENTPTEFSSLDYDEFEKMYDELLELLKEYKELIYQAIRDESVQDTSLLTEMLRNIEQLEFARSKENLLAIKLLYEAKKEELLKQFLLKEYVQKHPGIEHMGGVPKGGTFILVYYQEEESTETAATDQKETSALKKIAEADKAALTKEDYKIIDEKDTNATKKSYSNSFFTNDRKEALMDASYSDKQLQFLGNQLGAKEATISLLSKYGLGFISDKDTSKKLTIKEDTVVADFALPYLCCSDCSPIMFCVPEQDTSSDTAIVFLPDDTFCQSPGKEEYFNFTLISPEDGIIDGPGVSGDTASGFKFNPHDDEVSLGEVVFTVNGKSALKVEVIEAPVASFSYTKREGTDADEKPITILTLSNASTGADTYTWVFGDVTKELASTADFDYDVPAGTASPITVSLTASNKKCSDTDSQDINLATTEIFYIKLNKTSFCDQDGAEYDIKFGSDVNGDETVPYLGTIEGTGVLAPGTDNSTYRFAPKQATAGTHTINYLRSGTTVASIDVTVEQQFTVSFETTAIPLSMDREIPATIQFAFTKITPSGTGKYRWRLDGNRFESRDNNNNFNFEFIIEKLLELKEMEFSLDVTIDPCSNSNSVTIENPLILDNEKCADKLLEQLIKDLDNIKLILESKEIPDNIKERIVVPLQKLVEEAINGLSGADRIGWLEGKYNGIIIGEVMNSVQGIEEVISKYEPGTTESTVSIDMFKLNIHLISKLLACQFNDIETSGEVIELMERIKELITFISDNKYDLGYKEVDREAMAELILAIMTKPTLQLMVHRLYLDIFYRDK